jgi:hypothetical protein
MNAQEKATALAEKIRKFWIRRGFHRVQVWVQFCSAGGYVVRSNIGLLGLLQEKVFQQ